MKTDYKVPSTYKIELEVKNIENREIYLSVIPNSLSLSLEF